METGTIWVEIERLDIDLGRTKVTIHLRPGERPTVFAPDVDKWPDLVNQAMDSFLETWGELVEEVRRYDAVASSYVNFLVNTGLLRRITEPLDDVSLGVRVSLGTDLENLRDNLRSAVIRSLDALIKYLFTVVLLSSVLGSELRPLVELIITVKYDYGRILLFSSVEVFGGPMMTIYNEEKPIHEFAAMLARYIYHGNLPRIATPHN